MLKEVSILLYLLRVHNLLPGNWKQRRKILSQLRACVRDYASENADIDYESIVVRFGSPEDILGAYVAELDSAAILEEITLKRRIVRIVALSMLGLILLWGSVVGLALIDSVSQSGGYSIVTIVEG